MNKYVCIHSHFYQPPRENPWLDKIEEQPSASPYHDWNERISSECYRENGRSRIVNDKNFIIGFSNNYSKMSFNIGPTLLSWLERYDTRTYDYIIQGDQISCAKFNGHGNAIAQCYNHIIMPLANRRDKETQVVWGIRDFEKRFHRYPEAMWLSETAVDIESLEIMAKYKMKYVILAPRQARKVKSIDSLQWSDVNSENINTKISYLIKLPSGASIAAFFYDGAISKAVAFDGLLHNGEHFASRIFNGFDSNNSHNQIVNLATDGESYGHHHKFGEMALAYALKTIEDHEEVKLCNYGYFLELNPPQVEVEIVENSSWSCVHGVERWRSDCGCNSGGHPGWNQKWRAPLRNILDDLRNEINIKFEEEMKHFSIDPWQARNDYINVVFNRNEVTNRDFLNKWIPDMKLDRIQIKFIKAYELQRQMLLMYTSCAWFFDESSGIETVQVLQYALRAIELAEDLWGNFLLEKFVEKLVKIPSNIEQYENGKGIYDQILKNCQIDFFKIAVQFTVTSLFKEPSLTTNLYGYDVTKGDLQRLKLGSNKFVCGHAEFRSRLTFSKRHVMFAAVHLGESIISAGVTLMNTETEYGEFKRILVEKIQEADFTDVMREIDKHFEKRVFSLRDLIPEDRSSLIKEILTEKLGLIESRYQQIYNDNYTLVSFLNSLNIEMPIQLKISFEHVVNEKIIQMLKGNIEDINIKQIQLYLDEVSKGHLILMLPEIKKVLQLRLIDFADGIKRGHYNKIILENFLFLVQFAHELFPNLIMSEIQFLIYQWGENTNSISKEYVELVDEIYMALKIINPKKN